MEKYENEEYLQHQIMDQSRHQFIFGYDGIQRKQFLENMASHYPIVLDKRSPMSIYVTELGLPKIPICDSELSEYKIYSISREFLYFSIASDIILKAKSLNDITMLNEKMKKLIDTLNKYGINNKNYSRMEDIDDLIRLLLQSKEFYKNFYIEYYGSGKDNMEINDIALPFLNFDMFIRNIKSAFNNESYFGVIIDKQSDIALSSTKAINDLVGSRINKDISMKIATEPDKWDSYRNSNGQIIESVHDYGTVELDDSQSQYLKKLKGNSRIQL